MPDSLVDRVPGALDDIVVTHLLESRPTRAPDYDVEARALGALVRDLATHPKGLLQKVVETTREVCAADSAGVSILEPGSANALFRWHAVDGAFASRTDQIVPRDASPCGNVISSNSVMLFDRPGRYFPSLTGIEPPVYEALLAPWQINGRPVGTLWAISHTPDRHFDAEDARLLASLADVAAAAWQAAMSVDAANARRDEVERLVEERTRELATANSRLRIKEERIRRALTIDTVGVLFFKLDGRMLDVNPAFERMSGYNRDELRRSGHWESMTPPEFAAVTRAAAARLFAGGKAAPYEKQLVRKDGSRWWGLFAPTVLTGTGRDAECVEFVIDVTDSKAAEERLRQSDAKYRSLFNSIDEGFVVVQFAAEPHLSDFQIVECNPAAERLTGLRDMVGRRVRELIPEIESSLLDRVRQSALIGEPCRFEGRVATLDKWFDVHASPIAGEGSGLVAVVFQDDTARKRAEQRLRQSEAQQAFLIRLSDALRPLSDPAAIQAEATRILAGHLGLSRAMYGEVDGDTLRVHADFCAPGVESVAGQHCLASFGAFIGPTLQRGHSLVVTDLDCMAAMTAKERAAHTALGIGAYVIVPLVKDGRLAAFLTAHHSTAREWTPNEIALIEETAERTWAAVERARAEDALRQAHDQLEERVRERTSELARANASLEAEVRERRAAEEQIKALFRQLVTVQEQERRRIARDIHDQLGQQMTALRMNLESLRAGTGSQSALAAPVGRAQQLAQELDQSIDFLTWELRPTALDHLGLSAALDHLVAGWSERFQIPAEYDATRASSLRLPAETETNLYRVAQEALHNIYKHSNATRVSVLLERRNECAVLVVEDNGRGFDPADATREHGSRGLGLVSMRERATLLGGELEIESSPGQGTTVFVRVPLTTDVDEGTCGER